MRVDALRTQGSGGPGTQRLFQIGDDHTGSAFPESIANGTPDSLRTPGHDCSATLQFELFKKHGLALRLADEVREAGPRIQARLGLCARELPLARASHANARAGLIDGFAMLMKHQKAFVALVEELLGAGIRRDFPP